ncbi:phage portal protein [Erythrobacter sp. WG]|uniref:phage portal protein n=1 Tax=Erythrobacter sp. WG TaxID=2985510 RepID=UPI0022717CB2|nr:phage portal protein [Erythrobacter sp. WG]MCX9146609.1 phage portal protein [Erythrobacter sp. WG]
MSNGNFLTKALARVTTSLTQMRHAAQSLFFGGLLKRTRFDYAREVGDMLDASVVMAPIQWLQRALPEARLAMRERKQGGKLEPVEEHPLLELIRNPNPFYGDIALWGGAILSYCTGGDGYWIKVRDMAGLPVELWYVPHWMMEPKAGLDGSVFLSHYEYTPGTGMGKLYLDPADVIHFRHGLNPRDLRRGLSPLQGVIREIFADIESSNFVASLLRNMGVPGVVISPKGGAMPTPEDVQATKTWFQQTFSGDGRGGTLVMGAPTDVTQYGFNPQQMELSGARDVAEERVCAALGIPAAVVGFGAGLQQTKVGATMEELRKLAWHNGVLPLGRALIDELQRSLLPDFERANRGRRLELYWDTDEVLALQEDEAKVTERKLNELKAGAITLYDYLTETGREADDTHKYYMRPIAMLEVPLAEAGKPREARQAGQAGDVQYATRGQLAGTEPMPKALPAPARKSASLGDWLPADARAASEDELARAEPVARLMNRMARPQSEAFAQALIPLFQDWGDTAGRIAGDVLRARGFKEGAIDQAKGQKAEPDPELINQIIDLLNIEAWEQGLSSRYQAQYLGIARQVAETLQEAGFGTGLPDPVMRQIIAAGGTRAGLVDVPAHTRQAIFEALSAGIEEGDGILALANRIANQVEGGHWGNAETRARVIARTETQFAQNRSILETARAAGAAELVVFDGIFGEPRSELSHIARNGKIVSAEDARIMAENMRPNCTLSFVPHFSL